MWLLLNETHMILSNLIWPLGTRSASCKKENNLTNLLNLRIWLRQSTLNVDCIFYGRSRCVSSVVIWLNRLLNFPMSYLSLHNALDMGLLVLFSMRIGRSLNEPIINAKRPPYPLIHNSELDLAHTAELRGKWQERWFSRSSICWLELGFVFGLICHIHFCLQHT